LVRAQPVPPDLADGGAEDARIAWELGRALQRDACLHGPSDPGRPRFLGWPQLLARTFAVDVLRCDRCGGTQALPPSSSPPRMPATSLSGSPPRARPAPRARAAPLPQSSGSTAASRRPGRRPPLTRLTLPPLPRDVRATRGRWSVPSRQIWPRSRGVPTPLTPRLAAMGEAVYSGLSQERLFVFSWRRCRIVGSSKAGECTSLPDGEDVRGRRAGAVDHVRACVRQPPWTAAEHLAQVQFWTYSLRDPGAKAVDLAPQSTAPVMPGDMK
jgi:hypothetical protein